MSRQSRTILSSCCAVRHLTRRDSSTAWARCVLDLGPRAQVFQSFVGQLAHEKGRDADFALYTMVEEVAPRVIAQERHIYKGVSANVDFYSGFVYSMLGLPPELYTPVFAMARIVGWSAHRLEELINTDKIIRPAYRCVQPAELIFLLRNAKT